MAADPNVICQFKTLECVKELQLLMFSQTDQNLMDTYKFFTTCPCSVLEKIFIELATDMHGLYMDSYFEESKEPLMSDFSMVKTVKINGYKGRRNEIRLVRFFLSNAPKLKDMIIVAPRKRNVIYTMETFGLHSQFLHLSQARFSELPKSSMDAKIVVSERNDSGVCPKHEVYGNYTVSQEE